MINVLFSIPNFLTAGSGREMFNIIERLPKEKFLVVILIEKQGGNLYQEVLEKGYEVIVNNEINKKYNSIFKEVIESYKISKDIKKLNIDIWQSFHWNGNYQEALIARMSNVKYVYVKKNMNWNNKWKLKSFLSSRIIARNTTLTKTHFNSWLYRNKVQFITGAVDLEKFKKIEIKENPYRKAISSNNDFSIITCIAHILPIKNQLLLVEAVKDLDNVVLYLAGRADDVDYYNLINKYIQQFSLEKKVFLLGNVADTVELLNCSTIFVLPTNKLFGHEEGCPVALIEAMACGLTCIASNVAGSIDLIKNNENGYIFENNSKEGLILKINKAIEFPIDNAKNINYYSLQREANDFENVYLNLMN